MDRISSSPRPRPGRLPCLLALSALVFGAGAHAATVDVPNGDFSNPANFGSVGGLIGSGSGPIGSGPWHGRWSGILGVLGAPTLTISSGEARISGLVGVNIAGLLNNSGSFEQDTGAAWQPGRRYTLTADVTTSGVLNLATLQNGNVGVALASSTTRLASSATSSSVSVGLVSGNTYEVQLRYETGGAVSGSIGVHLFAEPSGLLTADLLPTLHFSNVRLDSRAIHQVPSALVAVDASPRSPVVGAPVDPPLAIKVLDADGDPIEGLDVEWTAPSSGPSATVTPNPTPTGPDGIARPTVVANTIAGSYVITGKVSGLDATVQFQMTNLPGPAAVVDGASGSGQGAVAGTPFAAPLVVEVRDAWGNVVPGVQVSFSGPATGAGASLPTHATTGEDGRAAVSAVANGNAGQYTIRAAVAGTDDEAAFILTNLLDPSILPIDEGVPAQNAAVESLFACALLVRVAADGEPQPGLAVEFAAPADGPSAILSDGVQSGRVITVETDEEGYAWVEATANAVEGDYVVTAQLLYALAGPIEFHLHNLGADDPIYASGFDGVCVPTTPEPRDANDAPH
ncbi:MAG: hypothetical protein J0H15_00595 [Xanthomonadales bacterium]|nr:hypothetical protein [Xanthomonadales bacterium]